MATTAGLTTPSADVRQLRLRLISNSAEPLHPLNPAASTSIESTNTPDGSTSETRTPASASQRGEPHGFGILQHTGPPVQDDIPGLYRDGRVRNPIPSKLKGKTDARKGNFGVMHIDLTTTNETQERDAAAKRTSEGTQLAAKLAQTDRYVPIRRSKFLHKPEDQVAPSSPEPTFTPQRTSPITAAEAKAEQARLLTLLRSLHPVLVVDQLCKALAFFGGIPGASPSTEEVFPNSAEANGSGSLFISWLAEIFPALGHGSVPDVQQAALKRPRGRPRGSKNSKGKKDIVPGKRLVLGGRPAQASEGHRVGHESFKEASLADDSWVDIDETAGANEDEGGEDGTGRQTACSSNGRSMAGPSTSGSVPGNMDIEVAITTPTPKRRGRPKGSKNRPKDTFLTGTTQTKTDVMSSTAALETADSGTPSIKKRKPGPGRPKGSKNRPKESPVNPDLQSTPAPPPRGDIPGLRVSEASPRSSLMVMEPLPVQSDTSQCSAQGVAATPVSQEAQQTVIEPHGAKSVASGGSKGVKRKRKTASDEAKITNTTKAVEPSLTAAPTPVYGTAELAVASISQDSLSTQGVEYGTPPSGKTTALIHAIKKQKLPKDSQQKPASINRKTQSIDNRQSTQTLANSETSRAASLANHYGTNHSNVQSSSSVQRARHQTSMAVNRSPLQKNANSQQSSLDMQMNYSQSRSGSGDTAQQVDKSMSTATYSMSLSGRPSQSTYNQVHPPQGQYGHQPQRQHQQLHQYRQQQHQESRQQTTSHSGTNSSQHHLMDSSARDISPAAGPGTHPFTASTSDGGYHALTSASHQPSFGTQVTGSAPSPDKYRNSSSRSVLHQAPSFQARQVHHTSNSALSSFQDYPDSGFLDIAGLESVSQAGLAGPDMVQAQWRGHATSPTVNPSYGSASSVSQTSFDGGMTEPALRERIYPTLRRQ